MPNIDRKLVHTINYTTVGTINMYGEKVDGQTYKNVPCLIEGSRRRVVSEKGTEVQADYKVRVSSVTSIAIDSTVNDGYDFKKNKIINSGTVIGVRPIIHPLQGVLFYELDVKRGE